jgi:dTDP-4-dehydrorhamnose 3,5-epimerase
MPKNEYQELDVKGVWVKKLRLIPDERGFLMECLRNDDPKFDQFGQVYVSAVYKEVVKGWHCHHQQTDRVVCVHGMIKLAVFDDREDSETHTVVDTICIGDQNPCLVVIPPRVYHGWMGLTDGLSLVMNCPNRLYNYDHPDEHRLPADDLAKIGYEWKRRNG